MERELDPSEKRLPVEPAAEAAPRADVPRTDVKVAASLVPGIARRPLARVAAAITERHAWQASRPGMSARLAFIARIPLARELLMWNCVIRMRKRA